VGDYKINPPLQAPATAESISTRLKPFAMLSQQHGPCNERLAASGDRAEPRARPGVLVTVAAVKGSSRAQREQRFS